MATLQRLGDEALCPINLNQMRIGRAADNEIIIEDDAVSGHHALISMKPAEAGGGKEFFIEDLGSTNHTFVNNKEIKRQQLNEGDIIRIGTTRLKFSTKEYTPPQEDFQETRKLSGSVLSSFLFKK